MVGGPPLRCAIKKGEGRRHTVRGSPCAAKPTEKTLARSEGAQKQREAAASAPHQPSSSTPLASPPPQPTPSRRRRFCPRHRRPGVDLSALFVAAFEQISINEPVMAGPSSSAGTEGPQSISSIYFLCVIVVDLGLCCTQIKERERNPTRSVHCVILAF